MNTSTEWFREFFDRLYYETYRPEETEERNRSEAEFIAKALGLSRGSRVLDIGCGYARHAVYLARMGCSVVCLDISDYLLEKARERIKEFGVEDIVEIVKQDMRFMDFKEEFDGAFLFFTTFGYFSDEENELVLRNIHRALKKNGKLLIDILNPFRILVASYFMSALKGKGPLTRKFWWESGNYYILEEVDVNVMKARIISKRTFIDKGSMKIAGTRTSIIRYYMPHELIIILNRYGFNVLKLYGNYKGEEYTLNSPRLIVIAKKS